jgi:hypothetical protein
MRHPHNPRLPLPHNPTHFHQPREHRRSQRSRQMWLPLRPIQTPPRKRPSPSTNSCDINANPPKKFFAIPPQLILPFAASANSTRSLHSPRQLHRNNPRQMVVARPCHPNIRIRQPRIRHTRSAAITIRPSHRQRTSRFQRVRHIRIRQFVIPVPPPDSAPPTILPRSTSPSARSPTAPKYSPQARVRPPSAPGHPAAPQESPPAPHPQTIRQSQQRDAPRSPKASEVSPRRHSPKRVAPLNSCPSFSCSNCSPANTATFHSTMKRRRRLNATLIRAQ